MQNSHLSSVYDKDKLIKEKTKQKLSFFGKVRLFLYKTITGNKISANAIFRPLKSRLNSLNTSDINHLTKEELFNLKLHVSSYLKYLKAEEKIKIVDSLINQVETIKSEFYINQPSSKIDSKYLNPKKIESQKPTITSKKQVTKRGRVYTHVSVFEELSDYKDWLNVILEDANSASFVKGKSKSSNSQFQLDLNVHQFAALFYLVQQEKILIIPEGKKKEFARTITTVFHTKSQKTVSVDSFINKFSKPEIEAADYWAIEFANLRTAAKKID